jgi:2-C-methyl-D-erythritol 4-phosphate cytidylyltransferase
MNQKIFTSLIFLAGGKGIRMGTATPKEIPENSLSRRSDRILRELGNGVSHGLPKQFRPLMGKPLARYSFEIFAALSEIDEIIIVCEPQYRFHFALIQKPVHFVLPGNRRQDSVYQGLMATAERADFICVHDSARPFVEKESIIRLLQEARHHGAAALAIPATNTIKQADRNRCVQRTLPREELWELQTPQAIRRSLFLKAYAYAHKHKIEATDDLSLIEALGENTYLVEGSFQNFKITTAFDWAIAEKLCASN